MVLIYIIWLVALVATVAISLVSTSTLSRQLSQSTAESAQEEAAQEAAVSRAILGLLDSRLEKRWRVDGTPQNFTFANATLHVAIQDELGRIDLNHADRSLLVTLFQSAEVSHAVAVSLVDRIVAWRDPNAGTMEEVRYREAERAYRPRRGPFQSIDELQLVLGMTPDLYVRLQPAMTVYSGRPFLDPRVAPPQLRAVLQVASTAHRLEGVIDLAAPLRGRAFTIQIRGARGRPHEVAIRLTEQLHAPWVLAWRKS